jgi:predicted Zn-dependent peptidase
MANSKADIVISAPFSKKPELNNILFKEAMSMPTVKEHSATKLLNVYTDNDKTKVLTDIDNKNQAEIIMAYKYKVNNNIKDTVALELLNKILGGGPSSRLFSDLREQEKPPYSVRSKFGRIEDIGVMKLSIGTTTENKDTGEISYDNVQKSIEGFKRHVNKMKNEKVTEEELTSAKLSLKNDILSANEGTSGKTSSLGEGLVSPYGLSKENQVLDMVDKITVEDIHNAANYIFSGKPVYSVLATENTLIANKDI